MNRIFLVLALVLSASALDAQDVTVTLSEWKIIASHDTLPAGQVTFNVKNSGTMTHGLSIRGEGLDKATRDIPARSAASLTVTLKPGTYELLCPMSEESHKMAGMSRKLIVTASR